MSEQTPEQAAQTAGLDGARQAFIRKYLVGFDIDGEENEIDPDTEDDLDALIAVAREELAVELATLQREVQRYKVTLWLLEMWGEFDEKQCAACAAPAEYMPGAPGGWKPRHTKDCAIARALTPTDGASEGAEHAE